MTRLCCFCNNQIIGREHSAKVCFPCVRDNPKKIGAIDAINAVRKAVKEGILAPVKTLVRKVSLRPSARAFGQLRAKDDFTSSATPAASIADLGKGKIAAVWFNFGTAYMQGQTATAREFLAAVTHELIPQSMVEVTGSHRVEVALARNHGKLLVNLVNTSGPHADKNVLTLDEVTPLGPLEIIVRVETKPRDIHIEPGNRKIRWTFANGECRFALAGLDIHDVVVVE